MLTIHRVVSNGSRHRTTLGYYTTPEAARASITEHALEGRVTGPVKVEPLEVLGDVPVGGLLPPAAIRQLSKAIGDLPCPCSDDDSCDVHALLDESIADAQAAPEPVAAAAPVSWSVVLDRLRERLVAVLGLDAQADDDAIVRAVRTRVDSLADALDVNLTLVREVAALRSSAEVTPETASAPVGFLDGEGGIDLRGLERAAQVVEFGHVDRARWCDHTTTARRAAALGKARTVLLAYRRAIAEAKGVAAPTPDAPDVTRRIIGHVAESPRR